MYNSDVCSHVWCRIECILVEQDPAMIEPSCFKKEGVSSFIYYLFSIAFFVSLQQLAFHFRSCSARLAVPQSLCNQSVSPEVSAAMIYAIAR